MQGERAFDPVGVDQDDILIVYTAGTTGKPKGAVLTQSALLWNGYNSIHAHDLSQADHVLSPLPMFHVGGLNNQTRSEEHTSELQSRLHLVCRLLLEKKKKKNKKKITTGREASRSRAVTTYAPARTRSLLPSYVTGGPVVSRIGDTPDIVTHRHALAL